MSSQNAQPHCSTESAEDLAIINYYEDKDIGDLVHIDPSFVSSYDKPIDYEDLVHTANLLKPPLPNTEEDTWTDILLSAIRKGDSNTVIQLIEDLGPNNEVLTMPDARGNTPLHWAAHEGMYDVCDLLYDIYEKAECLLNQNIDGDTVLMMAIYGRQKAVANLLINRSDMGNRLVDIDANDGFSPLINAVRYTCADVCRNLYNRMNIRQICKQTKRGDTALHYAATWYHDGVVIKMVDILSKDPNKIQALLHITDNEGKTAL